MINNFKKENEMNFFKNLKEQKRLNSINNDQMEKHFKTYFDDPSFKNVKILKFSKTKMNGLVFPMILFSIGEDNEIFNFIFWLNEKNEIYGEW
jgi:hypothetical protein